MEKFKLPTRKEAENDAFKFAESLAARPTVYVQGFMKCFERFIEPILKASEGEKKPTSESNAILPDVSGSVFFAKDKYYHKNESGNVGGEYFFKCESLHKGVDAYGIKLYISPGKKLYRIIDTAEFIYDGWKEITKTEFIAKTKKYISRAVESFS